jgi:hypothetical protein
MGTTDGVNLAVTRPSLPKSGPDLMPLPKRNMAEGDLSRFSTISNAGLS